MLQAKTFLMALGLSLALVNCTEKIVRIADDRVRTVNREIIAIDQATNAISINNQPGDGMAMLEEVSFSTGTVELELKGENKPGQSFVGLAFNIQNDSTYEAVYFRPFNFQSDEEIRRAHSIQYIFHPKHTWRYLRTNHEGQFEAEFPRRPSPDQWFRVQLKIDDEKVSVYDMVTNTALMSVDRLTQQVSDKIGLWTGNNSQGAWRNLKVRK